jgi:oxalate decarboxylase/phosphoglucose isomerase-like protein (cupin superfamily)
MTDLHTRNTLPGNEKAEVKRPSGTVVWNPKPVTHEVTNAGDEPFWCVLVEHP